MAACNDDCEDEEWTTRIVLQDNDRGASRHSRRERENFKKLPDLLVRGDVLVVWEPSRITRNMLEFGPFCDLLAERGVPLYYDGRLYDMNDDDDRNRVWGDILDGAKQVGKTRKRVMRALNANLEEGKPHGRPAPGYRIIRDGSGKPIGREVIPEQALMLREMGRRAVEESATWYGLARDFKEQWQATGLTGRFRPEDVKRILTNPTLFGMRGHGGQVSGEGTWEAILDPEWFGPLRSRANSTIPETRGSEPRYWLTYIARCGVCLEMGEQGVIYFKKARGTRSGRAYGCRMYDHVQRDMGRVDDYVEELLMQLLEDPETAAKLELHDADERSSVDTDLALIEQLRGELREYIRTAAKTRMSADAVAVYVEETEAQIREAQQRVDSATAVLDPAVAGLLGAGARVAWEGYTLEQRRRAVRSVMTVTLVPVEKRGRYSEVGVVVDPIGVLAG